MCKNTEKWHNGQTEQEDGEIGLPMTGWEIPQDLWMVPTEGRIWGERSVGRGQSLGRGISGNVMPSIPPSEAAIFSNGSLLLGDQL